MVEIDAQNCSQVDCEMQHEPVNGIREKNSLAAEDTLRESATKSREPALFGAEYGGDGGKHSGKTVDLGDKWSGPHPKRFKMFRWEDVIANSFGQEAGDGYAWNVNESTGWLGFARDRLQWKALIKNGSMDSVHNVGPSVFSENAEPFVGPRAPGESHGSQSESKHHWLVFKTRAGDPGAV